MTNGSRLIVGMTIAALAWGVLLTAGYVRGHPVPWFSVGYNLPVTVAFAGLSTHIALSSIALGPRQAIAAYGPIALVWCAGGALLFLRLVTKSIDPRWTLQNRPPRGRAKPATTGWRPRLVNVYFVA
jgi:hypothetical protein